MRSFLLLCLLILCPLPVHAEEDPSVLHQGDRLHSAPGGREIGKIRYSHRGRLMQRRGDWVRVQIDGYIWQDSTVEVQQIVEIKEEVPSQPLQLADYQVRWFPQDFNRKQGPQRAHVIAHFDFQSTYKHPLSCLDYRVHFYDLQGRPLHQLDVGCDANVTPLASGLYRQEFIWKEYNSAAGDIYRRLKRNVQQKTVRIDLTLLKAYYTNGDILTFSLNE